LAGDGRTNRRRVAAHVELLRAALPDDGRGVRAWLRDPARPVAFLGFMPDAHPGSTRPGVRSTQRVGRGS
jgi:hypothetical protein